MEQNVAIISLVISFSSIGLIFILKYCIDLQDTKYIIFGFTSVLMSVIFYLEIPDYLKQGELKYK